MAIVALSLESEPPSLSITPLNGRSFFDTVEFLAGLRNRHFQNYLALCPNHSAMFRHANGSRELMAEMFDDLTENELEIVLAQNDATIYFTKIHIADMKTVIETEATDLQGVDGAGK